jgi:hypothetical protein
MRLRIRAREGREDFLRACGPRGGGFPPKK